MTGFIQDIWPLIMMVPNGIIFFPPSEYLYFEAYWKYGGVSWLYFSLPLANSVGHYILFLIIRKESNNPRILISNGRVSSIFKRLINVSEKYSNLYFNKYDSRYYAILYGRCIPVVHTGVSVVAGLSKVSHSRFLLFTVFGNLFFSLICYLVINSIPKGDDYSHALLYAFIAFFLIYLVHMFIEKMLTKSSSGRAKGARH